MENENLEAAKSKVETLVLYFAKQRHKTGDSEIDSLLQDATAVLVAIEDEIAHPLVYVPELEESTPTRKSDTPIGDLASFGIPTDGNEIQPIPLDTVK